MVKECVKTPKQIRFDAVDPSELKKDIDFAKEFGKFVADKLS